MSELDDIAVLLLAELQRDARQSYRELGNKVGLTAPAVAARMRKLERDGVIRGYRVDIDPDAVGLPIQAFIRISSPGAQSLDIDRLATEIPEIVECHRVTGSESHIVRVHVRDVEHLGELIERFWSLGDTVTNIVTSTPVNHRDLPIPGD